MIHRDKPSPESSNAHDHTSDSLNDGFDGDHGHKPPKSDSNPSTFTASKGSRTRAAGTLGKKNATERFGGSLLDKYVRRMMGLSSVDHAIGSPAYRRLSYDKLFNGHVSKIRPTDFYRHLGEVEGYTLYCCSRPVRLREGTVVWVAIDIDNADHDENDDTGVAEAVRADIVARMNERRIVHVTQPSTHNRGFHIHFCVLFATNPWFLRIRENLALLRDRIRFCYARSGCSEVCLKGLPFVSGESVTEAVFGTLVRSPLPRTVAEAKSLLDMTNRPVSFQEAIACFTALADAVPLAETEHCCVADENVGKGVKAVSSAPPSPQVYRQGGHSEGVPNLNGISNDPLGRMNQAAAKFMRTHSRPPKNEAELIEYYKAEGYHTSQNDDCGTPQKRTERASKAIAWIHSSHQVKLKSNHEYYVGWLKRLRTLGLTASELTYTKGGTTKSGAPRKGRSIRIQHVALTMALIDRRIDQGQPHVPKTFLIKGSRVMAAAGEVDFRLDAKKFARAVKVLMSRGLLAVKSSPRDGVATEYARGHAY